MSGGDVAIVGMACVFPGADDAESFWRNVVNGVESVSTVPPDRWSGHPLAERGWSPDGTRPARGGFVRTPYVFDAARHRVMPAVVRGGDAEQFILLDVVSRALGDAGIGPADALRRDTDLVVGRGGYMSNGLAEVFLRGDCFTRLEAFLAERLPGLSDDDLDRLRADIAATLPDEDVDRLATCIPNLVASRAANRLDLGGAAWVVDAACASSLVAVEQALSRLRDGRCDVAVAAGVNFSNVPAFWYLFERLGALSRSGVVRPFDRRADGILVAEGAGALVLVRAEDAVRDGRQAHALVKGAGSASDGAAAGVLAPDSAGQVRALRRAYADARVDPDTIDHLEAHGTATIAGDGVELETIRAFFGERRLPHATRVVGSVKSMIGHAMPAAGMASLIKTARALSSKVLPPSLHCVEPHPALDGLPFAVIDRARPWTRPPRRGPRRAGVNAFGFGGIDAHVVLEEAGCAGPRARPVSLGVRRPTELLAFTAPSREALAGKLRRAARFVREDRGELSLEDVAHAAAGEVDPVSPCRVAVLRESLDGTDVALEDVASRLESGGTVRDEAAGILFGEAPPEGASAPPRVATIFPGLAFPGMTGEFPDHVLATCLHVPAAREVMDLAEDRDGHPDDALPTSFLLVPPAHVPRDEAQRLRARFAPLLAPADAEDAVVAPDARPLMHAGALLSNHVHWRVLQGLRVPVDMTCGQSIGDVSACWASGIARYEDTVSDAWKVLSVQAPTRARGATAVIAATEERVSRLAEGLDVQIAIHMSPSTQLLGGPEADLVELARRALESGVLAHVLPFPPIHTRYLSDVAADVQRMLGEDAPIRVPEIPFYSALLEGPVPADPDAIRAAVRDNFTRPVRFWQTVRRMYADGARIFVQVGSGSLAANARGVLDAPDATFLATDVAHRHPLTQIQLTAGALLERGVALDLAGLFAGRAPRTISLDAPRPAPARPPAAVDLTLYWPPFRSSAATLPRQAPSSTAELPRPARVARGQSGLPFVERIAELVPQERVVVETTLDLTEDLHLLDHLMVNAPVKPAAECLPVMPLAMSLEMLAECAALLAPGLGLVGFESVRARRWIAIPDSGRATVRVEADVLPPAGDGVVAVRAVARLGEDVAAEATVRFAREYEETLTFGFSAMDAPRPHPVTARGLYDEGHLFHGPRWQCLEDIGPQDDVGIVAELVVRSAADLFASTAAPRLLLDPVVLDGVGQVLGALVMASGPCVLPIAIERMEIYCPPPPPGTRVPVRVELEPSEPGARTVRARIEAQDGDGGAWFRIAGWQDVVLGGSAELNAFRRDPARAVASRLQRALGDRAVVATVPSTALRDVDPDWLSRLVLHRDELATYGELATTARRRDWLAGRLAAKDAVRAWLRDRRGAALLEHPAAIVLGTDTAGRPRVEHVPGGGECPVVSIAHRNGSAAAIVSSDAVGIDLESLRAASAVTPAHVAAADELDLVRDVADLRSAEERLTLAWCAKEAASKALGTGLMGRPRAWRLLEPGGAGRIVVLSPDGALRVPVEVRIDDEWILAIARAPSLAAGAAASAGDGA